MSNVIKSFRVIEDNPENIKILKNKKDLKTFTDSNTEVDILIEEARNKAKEILVEAEIKAKEIISNSEDLIEIKLIKSDEKAKSIIDKAIEESESIKKESKKIGEEKGYSDGYKIGYEEGYSIGEDKSRELIDEALGIKEKYIRNREELVNKLEPEIIELVISIYEKVLAQKVENDEDVIVELVSEGIKNLDSTEKLIVITSKEDFEILEKNKNRILVEASLIDDVEIKYDINLEKGDCILETPKGSIDLSIKEQMAEVKTLLNRILNNE